jgi:integrase
MNRSIPICAVAIVLAGLAGCGSADQSGERRAGTSDAYRQAAAEVDRANHAVERLQAALAVAEGNGARPADVAALRREVALAERRHVHAITALSDTAR